ncbi:MAG: hypothetical protein ABJB98_11585 [Actinomycetota bacterium]
MTRATAIRDSGIGAAGRARIAARTLRTDRWWLEPAITVAVLALFTVYATWRAFENDHYVRTPYLSPFYSPCLTDKCPSEASDLGQWIHIWPLSPALLILVFPLGFRLTCYYYRKAYYRSFWQSPPACAVAEPHARYTGETRFPLIFQNVHRYFLYVAVLFAALLSWDAIHAFRNSNGAWGHMGLGTVILVVNAAMIWAYTLSCHSCRHIMGGRLKHFSAHPTRYRAWLLISKLNARHMQLAWVSLVWLLVCDFYIRSVATGSISDPHFF